MFRATFLFVDSVAEVSIQSKKPHWLGIGKMFEASKAKTKSRYQRRYRAAKKAKKREPTIIG